MVLTEGTNCERRLARKSWTQTEQEDDHARQARIHQGFCGISGRLEIIQDCLIVGLGPRTRDLILELGNSVPMVVYTQVTMRLVAVVCRGLGETQTPSLKHPANLLGSRLLYLIKF